MKLEVFEQIFEKILKYQISWKCVQWKPSFSYGRTDRHDEANDCFSQFCERAYKLYKTLQFLLKPWCALHHLCLSQTKKIKLYHNLKFPTKQIYKKKTWKWNTTNKNNLTQCAASLRRHQGTQSWINQYSECKNLQKNVHSDQGGQCLSNLYMCLSTS
jgi:hypothetical protein